MNRHIPEILALVDAFKDPRSDVGRRARQALLADGGLSPATTEWGLETALDRYTSSSLVSLVRLELPEVVGLILARSVSIAPLRAIILPLLRGANRLEVRSSSKQSAFVRVIADCLPSVRIVDWPTPECKHVIAYGGDSTISTIERKLPVGTSFEGYSHGFGVALCLDLPSIEIGRRLALDVAAFDQFGCLSPQCIVTIHNAEKLAGYLWQALEDLAVIYPRSRDSIMVGAGMQWRGRIAALGGNMLDGSHCTVAHLRSSRLVDSPGSRRVAVVQVNSIEEVTRILEPASRYLTCVGSSNPGRKSILPADSKPRLVPLGQMQDPPLDGPEDLRPPLGRVKHQ